MRISITHPNLIPIAVDYFRNGAVAVFPTETCYGIGTIGLKSNDDNIRNIFTVKSRPLNKPLSLLISKNMIDEYIDTTSEILDILQDIWPSPVTIIFNCTPKASLKLSSLVNLDNPRSLAFRVPDHQILLDIIDQIQTPIIGTSANKSGSNSKYDFRDVFQELQSDMIRLWIDGGRLPRNPPSTLIDLRNPNDPLLLRRGSFAIEDYFELFD